MATILRPPRSLFLHVSALSDSEYSSYLHDLRDILDEPHKDDAPVQSSLSDEQLEYQRVGTREVRAWLKGRFRDISSSDIDKVLKLFSTKANEKDQQLSGGQLLAVFRLLMHLRRGGDVSEANVFIQADPSSPTTATVLSSSRSASSAITDSPTPDLPYESPLKSSQSFPSSFATNPFLADSISPRADNYDNFVYRPPPTHPSSASSVSGRFSPRRASLSSGPPPPPPASSKPRVQGVSVNAVRPGSTNPFLQRSKTHSGAIQPKTTSSEARIPPLPPRKPVHMSTASNSIISTSDRPTLNSVNSNASADTITSSISNSSNSTSTLPPPHRVTPLMQQSLIASRAGANLKRAQDEAGRTRVLEVIRSSSDVSYSKDREPSRPTNSSRSPEKGTRRPVPRPPSPSQRTRSKSARSASSEDSFEQIASARLTSASREREGREGSISIISEAENQTSSHVVSNKKLKPFSMGSHSDNNQGAALPLSPPPGPPPTHPARRPSTHSTSGRGTGKHVRSPSFQSYTQAMRSPFSTTAHGPGFAPPSSAPSSGSSSSSPSPSPASPHFSRSARSMSMHQPISSSSGRTSPPKPPPRRPRPVSIQFTSSEKGNESPSVSEFGLSRNTNNPFNVRSQSPGPMKAGEGRVSSSTRKSGESVRGDFIGSLASRFENAKLSQATTTSDRDRDQHYQSQSRKEGMSSTSEGHNTHRRPEQQQQHQQHHMEHSFASLQRKFSALQQRAQPTLVHARYKAEAGIHPRRGYVLTASGRRKEDGERLVDSGDEDEGGRTGFTIGGSRKSRDGFYDEEGESSSGYGYGDGGGMDPEFGNGFDRNRGKGKGDDDYDYDEEETIRGRSRGRKKYGGNASIEMDDLKLPQGEGWAPL